MDALLNILIYAVIPLLTVGVISVVKRELLRAAPLISTAGAIIAYIMVFCASGIPIEDVFGNSEWRAFFVLTMLIQLVIATVLTAIALLILRGKKK